MRRHASRPLRTFKVAAYIYILLLARIMYVYVLYLSVGSDNVVFLSHIAILWTVLTSRLASHCITSAYLTCTHVCKLGILPLSTGRSVTIRHTASGLSRHEVAETINMNVRERTGDEENGSRSAPHPHRTASDRFLQGTGYIQVTVLRHGDAFRLHVGIIFTQTLLVVGNTSYKGHITKTTYVDIYILMRLKNLE